MPLKGEGRYQVMIAATDGSRNETAYAGFIVSYSQYLRFRANPIVLREIAEKTGGAELITDLTPEELETQSLVIDPRSEAAAPSSNGI